MLVSARSEHGQHTTISSTSAGFRSPNLNFGVSDKRPSKRKYPKVYVINDIEICALSVKIWMLKKLSMIESAAELELCRIIATVIYDDAARSRIC